MIVPILITSAVILAITIYYIYYIAPKLNPLNKADAFIREKMFEEAELELRKSLEKDPSNVNALYKLGNIYFDQNEIGKGIEKYLNIVDGNNYNFKVEKLQVYNKLAESYIKIGDGEKGFQFYFEVLKTNPSSVKALYHVSFMALGQEEFELASRYFNILVENSKKSFEILFGAGISAFQCLRMNEAGEFFKEALKFNAHSDIANIAMAFSLLKRKDYKTGINYTNMIINNSNDENALFIAMRLKGILFVLGSNYKEGLAILQELLELVKKNDMIDEKSILLYDLGFTANGAENSSLASDYWNELYSMDKNYKYVQLLVTILRKVMDNTGSNDEAEDSLQKYYTDWINNVFPESYVWRICGLKSEKKINIKGIVGVGRESSGAVKMNISSDNEDMEYDEKIDSFHNLDYENFKIISSRIVSRLGFEVDETLLTYKDFDGVDFSAINQVGQEKVLIWVRRWKDADVGEIPLRNFAQAINDSSSKQGIFITTSKLTPSAENSLSNLSKVTVVLPEELGALLGDLV